MNDFDGVGEADPLLQSRPGTRQNIGDLKSAAKEVRQGFVRKVYGLLTTQLLVTVLIAAQIVGLADASKSTASWIQSHEWLLWFSVIGVISMMCCMICCREALRKYPTNYIILFSFTVFEAVLIGFVSSMFSATSLLLAAGATAFIFFALTAYAMFTQTDFTGAGPYIFAALLVLLIFGTCLSVLPLIGVDTSAATLIYDGLGVLVFSFCIIYDTQLMLGEWGGHKVAISIDEYVFASLNLYMDVINLFLNVLSLLGDRN
mmetsp:Transcript_14399/g.25334  ORF Transcript_14399/g.25334 Transcript_14399/m.25334 type:complete len:260 (-) Transcript_14399:43-822(-)|eukprot:CAMPEP_0197663368 /NCGR_PEP_ID=MMETSP1338-20131121/57144_1 /TAXON_ID=43686 ORGANISM="Pelagodinium beii, Strain RCC1491" /NCGR_SAMPLE_ID=MMETSP1338 /ASSEMBLY_ACC=CAM_ASM_000754 /LENGTH=259 /DNA_ID=CAMNT_0043241691 /DNA_START=103 /DNA_END=882 /DNA_ORIENTATION=+